jgi:hypothetical protein
LRARYAALFSARINAAEEHVMRLVIFAVALALVGVSAHAQSPTCKGQATEKKLAGAAMNSFMKKCESDAKKTCEADSKDRKLAGAAKNSHMKKCVADTVG